MGNYKYPCTKCKRVEDPVNCTNQKCKVWQKWFLRKWEELRRRYGRLN